MFLLTRFRQDEDWRPEHTELYQKVRQATLQNMMRNAFPELAQELQDQQQLAK
jgi:hypothetical protein